MHDLYKTTDREAAIRTMERMNDKSIVMLSRFYRKSIRLKNAAVADIPSVLIRPFDDRAAWDVDYWEHKRGLMFYKHEYSKDCMPMCDALLFTECPLTHKLFASYAKRARRDVIVYMPPSWGMQEEALDFRLPSSDYHRALLATVACWRGRDLTPIQEAAVMASGRERSVTAVFYAPEVQNILGIDEWSLRHILDFKTRGFMDRYDLYTPNVEPDLPNLLDTYRILEAEPNMHRGARMLRFGKLSDRSHNMRLQVLVRGGFVTRGVSIYILSEGYKEPDWDMVDNRVNFKRGQWYKMRNLIEAAPDYDLSSNSI